MPGCWQKAGVAVHRPGLRRIVAGVLINQIETVKYWGAKTCAPKSGFTKNDGRVYSAAIAGLEAGT